MAAASWQRGFRRPQPRRAAHAARIAVPGRHQPRVHPVGEDEGPPQLGHCAVEAPDPGQAAAEDVRTLLPRHVFSDTVVTRVVRNVHGDSSGVRGAAWLWPPEAPPA